MKIIMNNTMNGFKILFLNIVTTVSHRWQQLSRREQWLSLTGMVALFAWLIWQGVFVSLSEHKALAEKKLITSRTQLSLVQQQAEQILSLRAAGAIERQLTSKPMDQVVHELAGKHRLVIQRVQSLQRGQKRGELLDIDLANTRFDQLMGWLTELEQQHRIQVRELQLEATETSGSVVISRLQLVRS